MFRIMATQLLLAAEVCQGFSGPKKIIITCNEGAVIIFRTSFMWMTLFGRYISNEVTPLVGVIAPEGKLCASSSHPKKSHKTWFDKCICLRACDHIWV